MIILDTNVLSAVMRTEPEAPVVAWLDRQPAESVWITSITVFEARLGLALLPSSRRRQMLEEVFARLLEEDLENRVLDFDSAAATEAASIAADRRKAGRPVDMRDTQIAGIALARRATIATRNVRPVSETAAPHRVGAALICARRYAVFTLVGWEAGQNRSTQCSPRPLAAHERISG